MKSKEYIDRKKKSDMIIIRKKNKFVSILKFLWKLCNKIWLWQ